MTNPPNQPADYTPPKVWTWEPGNGGKFGGALHGLRIAVPSPCSNGFSAVIVEVFVVNVKDFDALAASKGEARNKSPTFCDGVRFCSHGIWKVLLGNKGDYTARRAPANERERDVVSVFEVLEPFQNCFLVAVGLL